MFRAPGGGQEEVQGLYCYAVYRPEDSCRKTLDSGLLNKGDYELAWSIFEYDTHKVSSFAIHFIHWPSADKWRLVLESICLELFKDGALAVWFGDHSSSPSVTSLDPILADSNIYAACAKNGKLIIGSDLDKPLSYLSDEQLTAIKWSL